MTIRGKKQTVLIRLNLGPDKGLEMTDIGQSLVYDEALAATKQQEISDSGDPVWTGLWNITHVASGHKIYGGYPTQRHTKKIIEVLLNGPVDWKEVRTGSDFTEKQVAWILGVCKGNYWVEPKAEEEEKT